MDSSEKKICRSHGHVLKLYVSVFIVFSALNSTGTCIIRKCSTSSSLRGHRPQIHRWCAQHVSLLSSCCSARRRRWAVRLVRPPSSWSRRRPRRPHRRPSAAGRSGWPTDPSRRLNSAQSPPTARHFPLPQAWRRQVACRKAAAMAIA